MILFTLASLVCASGNTASLQASVIDRAGHPVADIIVTAEPTGRNKPIAPAPVTAVMDQVNTRFVPYVLPIHTGSSVLFPNSDPIAHQVYSFSAPKHFELGLYRGRPHAPVLFDKPGIVVLGCNIHDNMIAYIFVTDAPYFGKTDTQGRWRMDTLPAGSYRISVWSPRFAKQEAQLEQDAALAEGATANLEFKLTQELRPAPPSADDARNRRIRDY